MCFLLLLGSSKGTYGKKSKNSERKKIVPTNPDLFSLLGFSKESCKRNQRIQRERKRLTPHPIYTMPILMHWNLSLTFFPLAERKINPPPRPNKICMESPLSVRIQGKLHSTVRPASGEALFPLYYIKHAQDLQGLSRAQSARAGHRHSQSAPLPCPARTGPAGTLPCPARPCWPPSQPVSPSPVFAGPGPVGRTCTPELRHARTT